jgi:hypothetical protein
VHPAPRRFRRGVPVEVWSIAHLASVWKLSPIIFSRYLEAKAAHSEQNCAEHHAKIAPARKSVNQLNDRDDHDWTGGTGGGYRWASPQQPGTQADNRIGQGQGKKLDLDRLRNARRIAPRLCNRTRRISDRQTGMANQPRHHLNLATAWAAQRPTHQQRKQTFLECPLSTEAV